MRAIHLALVAGSACPGLAQLVPSAISDGNVGFAYETFPPAATSSGGTQGFTASGVDHVFQSYWYYALNTDRRGFAFFNDGTTSTSRATDNRSITYTWNDVDNRGLIRAQLLNSVYSTGPLTGVSAQRMTVTNISSGPVTVHLYSYNDLDILGSIGNTAAQTPGWPTGVHTVTEVVTGRPVHVLAPAANRFEVGNWPTPRDDILNGVGGARHDLRNTGLPFAVGDYTGAYQWSRTLQPAATLTAVVLLGEAILPLCRGTAEAVTYDVGKSGTNGEPVWTVSRPFANSRYELRVSNGLNGMAPFVLCGVNRASFPLPFGRLLVSPVVGCDFFMPPFAGGSSSITFRMPDDCRRPLTLQAFFTDPGASGYPVAHTGGLELRIGSF